ncbi:MAG: trypsin-like peptidase domain-containing protein [Verrucomicrobiota bacterium]
MLKLALVALLFPLAASAGNDLDPLRPAMEQAIARVKPSLVRIQVVWVDYAQGREVKHEASGSGFIIKKTGYVVTNHHVAGRATRAVCVFSNNEEIEATLVGTDPMTDIAVLKLDTTQHKEFPTVDWGDSAAIAVGDTVLAMGSPLALSQSVTRGIISNAKMTMPGMFRRFGGFSMEGEDVGSLVRWVAHDAPIYPGNSGGPLVNLSGEVIGVNEISMGLGGAIPSNLARDVAEQIIAGGHVSRSWLGIEIQPLLKGSELTNGVLVGGVTKDSPAELAGFKSNDILLKLAGKDVSVRFDEEVPLLNLMVAGIPIGKEVEAVVVRAGKPLTLQVRTAEREVTAFKQNELKEWGMTAKNISSNAAREMKLENREGVLVTTTRPGGPCGEAKPNLQPGDVIKTIAGKPVQNVAGLIELTRGITLNKKSPVPTSVEFIRQSEKFLTVVKVGIRDVDDPGVEARKAWLPVAVQVITREMAEQLGTNGVTGVRIIQVYPNTTAATAGLKVGDLILEIDGDKIPASQLGDEEVFTNLIRQRRVGDKPEFAIVRAGQPLKLTVELARSPKADREMKKYQDHNFEFAARDLSFFDRVHDELPEDTQGALVTEVKDGGWAALGELQADDIIQFANGTAVNDAAALGAQMKAFAQQKTKFVVLRILRGIHTRYLELEPNWENGK